MEEQNWKERFLNMCQERYSGADCFLVIAKPVEEVISFIKLQIEKAKAESNKEIIKWVQENTHGRDGEWIIATDLLETLKK